MHLGQENMWLNSQSVRIQDNAITGIPNASVSVSEHLARRKLCKHIVEFYVNIHKPGIETGTLRDYCLNKNDTDASDISIQTIIMILTV